MTQASAPRRRGGSSSAQVILSTEPILYPTSPIPTSGGDAAGRAYTRFAPQLKRQVLIAGAGSWCTIDKMT